MEGEWEKSVDCQHSGVTIILGELKINRWDQENGFSPFIANTLTEIQDSCAC